MTYLHKVADYQFRTEDQMIRMMPSLINTGMIIRRRFVNGLPTVTLYSNFPNIIGDEDNVEYERGYVQSFHTWETACYAMARVLDEGVRVGAQISFRDKKMIIPDQANRLYHRFHFASFYGHKIKTSSR